MTPEASHRRVERLVDPVKSWGRWWSQRDDGDDNNNNNDDANNNRREVKKQKKEREQKGEKKTELIFPYVSPFVLNDVPLS